ncbi:MAG: hypothetical protein AAB631_00265 [Patescibacteria group bacterium]
MSRTSKKILYGVIYAFIFFFILRGIYGWATAVYPTCFDGISNQGEERADCGGPCTACVGIVFDPLRVEGAVNLFTAVEGRGVLFAKVSNPNTGYSARPFGYVFRVFNTDGQFVRDVEGRTTLAASAQKYIFAAFETAKKPSTFGSASLEIKDSAWSALGDIVRPVLSLPQNVKTIIDGNTIRVEGTLKNQGLMDAPEVEIIALLHDRSGFHDPFFAGKAVVGISSMSENKFSVLFPSDRVLADKVDQALSEVFVNIE